MLLPTYRLLAVSVSGPLGQSPGYLCNQALNNPTAGNQKIIAACGLNQIATYHLGAVLQPGGPNYNEPTLKNFRNFNGLAIQVHKAVENDPLLLIGNDAIHGNTHIEGGVVFPQNINLGVTHDPELVQEIGKLVENDSLISQFNWVYMPTVAVAQDLRWGRTYESFGQDPQLAKTMGNAYISGFQQIQNNQITGALACVKHFIGDGATQYGLDEGDDIFSGSEHQFWLENGLGYEGAIDAGALNFMVSYNAINGQRMHFGGQWNILNQFKTEGISGSDGKNYVFPGFAVSDFNGATRAAYFYNQLHPNKPLTSLPEMFAQSVNAGVDMLMLGGSDNQDPFDPNSPLNYSTLGQAFDGLKQAYDKKLIPESRIEDAVTRILAAKLAIASQKQVSSYPQLQSQERQVALKAAEESMVLLKNNDQVLPLNKAQVQNVVLLGDANDVGVQNGGWTINWQGQKGSIYYQGINKTSSGTVTLFDAVKRNFGSKVRILSEKEALAEMDKLSAAHTVVISVVNEIPYAEYMGDIGNSYEPDQWYDKGEKGGENAYTLDSVVFEV